MTNTNPGKIIGLCLIFFIPLFAWGQTKTVTGVVTDATGETIIGASILEVGTTNGTVTDIDGKFSLNVSAQATLTISYIGYVTQTVSVGGQTNIAVTLEEDTQTLEEVVVIGYGTQRKEAVTGSVASMRGDVVREVQTGNITSALAGRIPGVQMSQTNSKPGADMQIRIRGTRSFSGDNNPLVVLDGIPFAGTIGDINPDDIKSIDILKDASATAIYGSRGANGVVMVTTNKGTIGQKPKVTYNAYVGAKTLYHRYPMMTGDELYEMRKIAGMYKDTAGNPSLGADEALGNDTDWQDLIFDTGMVTNHDVNVANGTETGSYIFGGGYYADQSLLPGQNYSRISLRANIDQRVGQYLRFGLTSNNNYNVTNGQSISLYNTLSVSPLINPWNDDGTWKTRVSAVADANNWAYSRDAIENLGDQYADNQNAYASYNSLYGEVKVPGVEGLAYRLNLGLNLRSSNRGRYQGVGVFSATPTAASTGSLDKRLTRRWVVENLLTYDKNFGKHHINLTGLYSEEQTHYDRSYVSALNIPSDHFQYWNLGQASKSDVTVDPDDQVFEESALKSVMGRVMYDFDSRYMFSVAVRSDASSRLAKGHQWHTYPAISAGWNIARESFMKDAGWIDNLKLRVGWGQTSNQAVDVYATLGSLAIRPYNFGTVTTTGVYVTEVPNDELDWEYSNTINIGLDFSLLQSRLSGSIEYYVINTDKILMEVPLPSTAGVGSYWANVGESQNKGLELSLNGVIIENKDGWTWEAGLNFYTNQNKVVKLASDQGKEESLSLFKGHPINSIYDYEKIGLWQEGENLEDYEDGGHVGMIKVKYTGEYDANGKPVRKISADDRQIISADPKWQGGFSTRVAYKNWDLNIIGTYQHGGILVSSLHASNGYLNMLTGRRGNVKVDYWTPQNTDAKYPAPAPPQSGDNQKYGSTLGYFDASYFKVGQITLGYNFNNNAGWFKRSGIGDARLYFTLQNAFVLFSPFGSETGLDPVTNSYGNENAAVTTSLPYRESSMLTVGTNTPQTRNFIFGLNLSF
jgi:TonB-linked SusC/RagA family outer membrane protein